MVDNYMYQMGKMHDARVGQQSQIIVDLVNAWNIPPESLREAGSIHDRIYLRHRRDQDIRYADLVKQVPVIEVTSENGLSAEENVKLAALLDAYEKSSNKKGQIPFLIKEDPAFYDVLVDRGIITADKTGYKLWRGRIMPGDQADLLAEREPYDMLRAYDQMIKALNSEVTENIQLDPYALHALMKQIWHENLGDDSRYEGVSYFPQPYYGLPEEEKAIDVYRDVYERLYERLSNELGVNSSALSSPDTFNDPDWDGLAEKIAQNAARPYNC